MSRLGKGKAGGIARGEALLAEANEILSRVTIFGNMFGAKQQKHEEAAERFKGAGDAFKIGDDMDKAAVAYMKAVENWKIAGDNELDATSALVEAATCYKKNQPLEAISKYEEAVEMFNVAGRFGRSSQYLEEIGKLWESMDNYDQACEAYEQAAQFYLNDNKRSKAEGCQLKIANYLVKNEQYAKAGEIYAKIGTDSMDSNLGKYAAKGHFFNAALCTLAGGDVVAVVQALDTFSATDYTFGTCRECTFVRSLLTSIEENSVEDFATHCADFERISPLDANKTHLLTKAKAHILTEEVSASAGSGAGTVDFAGEEDEEDLS